MFRFKKIGKEEAETENMKGNLMEKQKTRETRAGKL
jgi:hypothetical protein